MRMDLVILDELGYLPFSQAGGSSCGECFSTYGWIRDETATKLFQAVHRHSMIRIQMA